MTSTSRTDNTSPAKPPAAERRRRSAARRIAFALILVAFGWLLLELMALVAWWLVAGSGYSPTALRAERANLIGAQAPDATQPTAAEQATRALADNLPKCVHPYLGYVMNPEDNSTLRARSGGWGLPISDYGFFDDGSMVRKRSEDTLLVGVTGGSVAAIFAYLSHETLADALRQLPGLEHVRVEFVRLACFGYKQPQQLLALDLMLSQGGELDVLINLDGVNDLGFPLQGHEQGVHPMFPSDWPLLSFDVPDLDNRRAVGAATWLRETRRDLAGWFDASWWSYSVIANFAWRATDRAIAQRIANYNVAAKDTRKIELPYVVSGPRFDGGADDVLTYAADVWERCSWMLHERCRARGIHYVHCLQPNQYAPDSKPLSAEERASAWSEQHALHDVIPRGYPLLRARGAELARRGVSFHDLSRVFADVDATVYTDVCCHFNQLGNDVMARAMAQVLSPILLANAGPSRRDRIVELFAAQPQVALARPFESAQLQVRGRLANQTGADASCDATYSCDAFVSSDPEVASVDRYGVVRALRPGQTTIEARLGQLTATFDVRVGFAPIVELDHRAPRVDDPALRARIEAEHIDVRLEPETALDGWLAIGLAPYRAAFCRELAFVDLENSEKLPLQQQNRIPITPSMHGRTIYLQAVLVDPTTACKLRMSNALAITL